MTVSQPRPDHSPSERRCIVSGKTLPTDALMRFVIGPDRAVVPDIRGNLGGRGIWIGAERNLLEAAVQQNLFDRAARTNVNVPTDLTEQVERLLVDRVSNTFSLARKAGQAVCGFEKVAVALKSGDCALLAIATDASENARKKLAAVAPVTDRLEALSAQEIGVVFSRTRAVQAAVAKGGLATQLKIDGRRLAEFRGKSSLDEGRHDAEI
ncbi:MAG TPA: RNA-binding protein [Rhodospirillaceae bacterium]|nr:RNA-binding protein [Rhodospirillaceae bacterium]